MDTYTVTLTASQLEDIRTLTGETIPARKVPKKRTQTVTGVSQVLPPSDRMAAPCGTVSDGLEAYMTEHAKRGFVTRYKPTPQRKFARKTSPLPAWFKSHEETWNRAVAEAWAARAVSV